MQETDSFLEERELGAGGGWERRVSDTLTLGAFWLAVLMAVSFLICGQASRREQQDLLELVMAGNFGKNWRQTMHDASQTNQVQFDRMRAILHHVNGEQLMSQPPATESSAVD